jgi:hypothetical protein
VGGGRTPRRLLTNDPNRPPALYEFSVDSFWMQSAGMWEEPIRPPLRGRHKADVAIVGGGFAGMATAYHLARRFPEKRIVLLEGARCGYGASGRNGGFADPGMPGLDYVYDTHGPEGARAYYDATLLGLGQIGAFVGQHGVDCDFEQNGSLELATEQAHVDAFGEQKRRFDAMGIETALLDGAALRKVVHSERFVGALASSGPAILNPAKLALGMRRTIESLGVVVSERSVGCASARSSVASSRSSRSWRRRRRRHAERLRAADRPVPRSHSSAHQLRGRDRAALGGAVGRDRLVRPRGPVRRARAVHVSAAQRRRPHRLRRRERPLLLRQHAQHRELPALDREA